MTDSAPKRVVVNDEEQHAIVPASFPNPPGWRDAGFAGEPADCEQWVEKHWPDIRPRSVRAEIQANER